MMATMQAPFIIVAGCFSYADKRPSRFRKYKIQPNAKPLTATERSVAWKVALFNVMVITPILVVFCSYPAWKARGPVAEFSWKAGLFELFVVFPILADAWFFLFHKLAHHKAVYK
jgi:sterol desaturase/sphingolipid hydroxylase (fatty acid hydroxylase superfamily)